jgi:Cof subfamily protein (haloacid dehalogenase superfamily)
MTALTEKIKDIKIVFFDIDDTLRVKTTGFMPESVSRAFDGLRARGIYTGIATGRNLAGVVPEIKALQPDFFVTANGAYVEDKARQVIYNRPLAKDLLTELITWLESVKSEYVFYGREALRVSHWTPIVQEAIEIIYGVLPEELDFWRENDVYQILSLSDHDDQIELPRQLADRVRRVRWHPHSSDIVPIAGSKADGVNKVLEKLGFTAANLLNFGDELNDLELFDFASVSVALAVSHPEILERADFVTDTVEKDGVFKALCDLGLIAE